MKIGYIPKILIYMFLFCFAAIYILSFTDPKADLYYLIGKQIPKRLLLASYSDRKLKYSIVKNSLANDSKKSAAILGTSRHHGFNTTEPPFSYAYPNSLNLTFAGALILEMEVILEHYRKKFPNSTVFIALDYISFQKDYKLSGGNLYITNDPIEITQSYLNSIKSIFHLETYKLIFNSAKVRNLIPVRSDGSLLKSFKLQTSRSLHKESLRSLRKIIIDKNMIHKINDLQNSYKKLVFFINPLSKWQTLQLKRTGNLKAYTDWKHQVSKISQVVHFEKRWPELSEPKNWEDIAHFTPNIAKYILQDLVLHTQCKPLRYGHYDLEGNIFQRTCT